VAVIAEVDMFECNHCLACDYGVVILRLIDHICRDLATVVGFWPIGVLPREVYKGIQDLAPSIWGC
jgi:hypothetical protein